MSYRDPELNKLWKSFLSEPRGTAPGWITVELDQDTQSELGVGPTARARPNLETGGCDVVAAPSSYDLTMKSAFAHMESLQGAFSAFSKGGMFRMPHNLQISHLDPAVKEEDNSMHEEALVIERIIASQKSPDEGGARIVLVNPSRYAMSVALKFDDVEAVVSEQYVDNVEADFVKLEPARRRYGRRMSVEVFPVNTRKMAYTGSLGAPGRGVSWIGLQPDPYGPNVVGRHHFSWGLTYQYVRNGRTRELSFDFSPGFNRYTTKEFFGVESNFFVNTSEVCSQRLWPGEKSVVGFTEDPSPRLHGSLGKISPVGKYVLRADSTCPERHTAYVTDGPFVHYGVPHYPVDRQDIPEGTEIKVYHMRSHSWVTLHYPLPIEDPPGTYATFFEMAQRRVEAGSAFIPGARVEHSEQVFHSKFGAVVSLDAAVNSDQIMTQYATGLAVVRAVLPARQNSLTRDRGSELIVNGLALIQRGVLVAAPDGVVIVGTQSLPWERFLLRVHQTPQRAVLLTWEEERLLRLSGYEVSVGLTRRCSVFPCSIPREGWSDRDTDCIPLIEF